MSSSHEVETLERTKRFWQSQKLQHEQAAERAEQEMGSMDVYLTVARQRIDESGKCPVVVVRDWMRGGRKCGEPVSGLADLRLPGLAEAVSVKVCREHLLKCVNIAHQQAAEDGTLPKCCLPIFGKHHPDCARMTAALVAENEKEAKVVKA